MYLGIASFGSAFTENICFCLSGMNLLRKYSPQVHAFARKSFTSLKFPGESLDDITSPSLIHGVHVFHCPDEVGIVAKLSECIASRGGNILNADIFVPEKENVFYARRSPLSCCDTLSRIKMIQLEVYLKGKVLPTICIICSGFVFDPAKWPRMQMDEDFLKLSKMFNAMRSVVWVPNLDPKYKISVLASKQDHCLVDLLHEWQYGRLPVHITSIISNHDRGPNTHVMRFLERHGIPYHFLETTKEDKREGDILNLVKDTDFLVLARYMQVLSGGFLRSYGKDIINIHHGLLPSFKGGNPSKQAFEAGVKLIGATSHFVTEELDEGPIIEQMSFVQKSENLEKQCLSKAIKSYCELRVLPYEKNRTVVF